MEVLIFYSILCRQTICFQNLNFEIFIFIKVVILKFFFFKIIKVLRINKKKLLCCKKKKRSMIHHHHFFEFSSLYLKFNNKKISISNSTNGFSDSKKFCLHPIFFPKEKYLLLCYAKKKKKRKNSRKTVKAMISRFKNSVQIVVPRFSLTRNKLQKGKYGQYFTEYRRSQ